MRTAFAAALVLLFSSEGSLRAQDREIEPAEWVAPGYLAHAAPISPAAARTRCPELSKPRAGCRAVEMVDLGMAGGRRWSVGIYQAPVADTFPEPGTRDTVVYSRQEETLVVYSAGRGGGALRPEWWGVYWPTWFAEVVPQVGDAPRGGTLLSLVVCWNGTAGCTDQFLKVRRADGWHRVRRPWVDALPRRYRTFARGAFVNVRKLTTVRGLWTDWYSAPEESRHRWIVAQLAWRGAETLGLRHYRIALRDPYDGSSETWARKSTSDAHLDVRPLHPPRKP